MWMLVGAALVAGTTTQTPPSVGLATVRFLRGGKTLIDGFVQVPYGMLQVAASGADRKAYYRVSVDVRDSTGTALLTSGWTDSVAGQMLRLSGVTGVQHFAFTAPAGRYAVDVSVTDSASRQVLRAGSVVKAFSDHPRASDLLLSGAIRQAGTDTVPGPGEIRKGSVFLVAGTAPA